LLGDNISIHDMPLPAMIRKALAGNLGRINPRREMGAQRAFRIESAESIINGALDEGRALTSEECARVDQLLAEADQITPVIAELWKRRQREIEAI